MSEVEIIIFLLLCCCSSSQESSASEIPVDTKDMFLSLFAAVLIAMAPFYLLELLQ